MVLGVINTQHVLVTTHAQSPGLPPPSLVPSTALMMEGSRARAARALAISTLKKERSQVDGGGSLGMISRTVARTRLYIHTAAMDKAVMWNR